MPIFLAIQTYNGSWQIVFYVDPGMAFTTGGLVLLVLRPLRARFVAESR